MKQSKAHREDEAVLHLQAGIETLTLETNQLKSKIENQVVYVNDLETSNKCKEKAVQNLQVSNEALTTEKEKLKSKTGTSVTRSKYLRLPAEVNVLIVVGTQ